MGYRLINKQKQARLLKNRLLGPIHTVFNSVGLEWGPETVCLTSSLMTLLLLVPWDCALSVQTTALQPIHPVAGFCKYSLIEIHANKPEPPTENSKT